MYAPVTGRGMPTKRASPTKLKFRCLLALFTDHRKSLSTKPTFRRMGGVMKSNRMNAIGITNRLNNTHAMNTKAGSYPAPIASGIAPRSSMKGTTVTRKTNHSINPTPPSDITPRINQYSAASRTGSRQPPQSWKNRTKQEKHRWIKRAIILFY